MPDYDRALLNYLHLAVISAEKHQPLGKDRFLVLAGAAACHAGLLDIAEECRRLVLQDNPRHQIGHHESFADALRSEEFQPLLKQLRQLCPPEQAEFLARDHGVEEPAETDETSQKALALLNGLKAD